MRSLLLSVPLLRDCQNFRDHSRGQRSTITFLSVKNSTASRPCACITPKKLPFQPEKGKYAMGAGTPMLTPTLPVETALRNLRAAAPEDVKMELALP
jgi:hypothetical protein